MATFRDPEKSKSIQGLLEYYDRYRSSAAVAGYGAEGRAVIFYATVAIDPIALCLIKTKNHFDTFAEVAGSEEVHRRQTGQERQDQA